MTVISEDGEIQFAGGCYVGCRVRIAPGTWETGACKKPALNAWPVGEWEYVVVCDEHYQQMQDYIRER
jgi:hypothetical protein